MSGIAIQPVREAVKTDDYGRIMAHISSRQAGTYQVSAHFPGNSQHGNTKSVEVVFKEDSAQTLHLTTSTDTLVADGTTPATLIAIALNADGKPAQNVAIAFRVPDNSGATLGITDPILSSETGQAINTVTGTRAGELVITAQAGSHGITAVREIMLIGNTGTGDINNAHSSVTQTGSPAIANGSDQVTVTVTLKDDYGNPLAGQPVAFPNVEGLNLTSPVNNTTNWAGQISANATSIRAGTYTVAPMHNNKAHPIDIVFTADDTTAGLNNPNAGILILANDAAANGVAQNRVAVTLTDRNGNPVTGETINFQPVDDVTIQSENDFRTDVNGQAIANLTSIRAGAYTIDATYQEKSLATNVNFIADPASATISSLTVSQDGSVANKNDQNIVIATLTDPNGNPVANQQIMFAPPLSGSAVLKIIPANNGFTDDNGQVTASITSTLATTFELTASFYNSRKTAQISFIPGPAYNVSLPAIIGSLPTDGSKTLDVIATVRDRYGNQVADEPVSFCISRVNKNAVGVVLGDLTPVISGANGDASTTVTTAAGKNTGPVNLCAQITVNGRRVVSNTGQVSFTAAPPTSQ